MRTQKFTRLSLIAIVALILTGTAGTPPPSISSALEGNKTDALNAPLLPRTLAPRLPGSPAHLLPGTLAPQQQAENVELIGQIGGPTNAVAVQGEYVYIGMGPRLVILDVSDPAHPRVVGQTPPLPDIIKDMVVVDGLAYLADYGSGLRIIDVSYPVAPTEVGFYDTPGLALDLAVAGSTAYVADFSKRLRIIDVSNPTAPTEVGLYDTPGWAEGVAVAGDYAYVTDGDLRIIDVSNPATPTEVGFYNTPGGADGIVIVGDHAYIADSFGGLGIIDVSNPAAPTEVGLYDTPWSAVDVAVVGDYAYVAEPRDGLRLIDVSNPASPTEAGFYDTPGNAWGVAVAGGFAYVAADEAGLRIINVSNPTVLTEVSFFDTTGDAWGVAVAGDFAYIADGEGGLRVVNVSNPAAPTEVGTLDTPDRASGVAVAGTFAYVTNGEGGLRVINVSNPAAPSEVGAVDTPGYARSVAVAGDLAYVAADEAGLRIINVSNPVVPAEVGFYDGIDAHGVAVSGGYAYVAEFPYGLRIFDVRNPATPTVVSYYTARGTGRNATVAGDLAYLADGDGGLRVIDVSDPAAPIEAGFFDTADEAWDVVVVDGFAYVANREAGLVILRYTGAGAMPTPSPTSTPTSSPTPTLTPTVTPSPGDPYEPDDTCAGANAIAPDGTTQKHTIHTAGDTDWLRFSATAGTHYVISALQAGASAHPIIRLYDQCGEDPFADSSDTFGFDQIIAFRAERSGLYYLKLAHLDEDAHGTDTAYQVSVRPATTGAAVVAGGRLYPDDDLQPQITFMTERAYQVFRRAGYADDEVYYTSADPNSPLHMDAPSSAGNLRYAITSWALQRIDDGEPLYLYLTDHGEKEFFFLDTGQNRVTPEDLDAWLLDFENQRPNSPIVIIIEACRAGSFITPLGTISRPGRVVVTASGEDTDAYAKPPGQGGAHFSDAFFDALAQSYDVWHSYTIAQQVVQETVKYPQMPWIDGNGNGVPYPLDEDDEGAGRSLGLGRGPGLSGGQPPFIEHPDVPRPTGGSPVQLAVRVLDENPAGLRVWMMVTKPSTPPPSAPPGYITPISHAERVDLVYNPTSGKFETAFTFDELGAYQFVFHAEDAGGQRARAVSAGVLRTNVPAVYLPLVRR